MVVYAELHQARQRFEGVIVLLLLAVAVAAWTLMFLQPLLSMVAFLAGLCLAGIAALVDWGFRRAERSEGLRHIRSHRCPSCGGAIGPDPGDGHFRCGICGADVLPTGLGT